MPRSNVHPLVMRHALVEGVCEASTAGTKNNTHDVIKTTTLSNRFAMAMFDRFLAIWFSASI